MEPKKAPGFSHSRSMSTSKESVHLWAPPEDQPPPERELDDEELLLPDESSSSIAATMITSTRITSRINSSVPQPQPMPLPRGATGPASPRRSRSFFASRPKALATASLSTLAPTDQVRS